MHFFLQINKNRDRDRDRDRERKGETGREQVGDWEQTEWVKAKRNFLQRKCEEPKALVWLDASDNSNGVPLQFCVLCFCRENNLHMHKFAFRILIYRAKSPSLHKCNNQCTVPSSRKKEDEDRQKLCAGHGKKECKQRQRRRRLREKKREGRNEPTHTDDEINGPVILKHLLATARLPWIRVCFAKRNTRKKIIKNWKEKKAVDRRHS